MPRPMNTLWISKSSEVNWGSREEYFSKKSMR